MLKIFHHPIAEGYRLFDFILQSPSYRFSSIEECNLILHSKIIWGEEKKAINKTLSNLAKSYTTAKPILLFIVADYEGKLKVPARFILMRTSLNRSTQHPKEIPFPYIWDNYKHPFEPVEKRGLPAVGFCGLASKPRRRIIKYFQESEAVQADFICREKFWGGKPHDENFIREFDENVARNMYILAPRGKGNFSMRFYQSLSAGRIPVLTDTDTVLPFAEKIPWKEIIIFEKNEKRCLESVLETFHSGRHIALQRECREIYDRYFSELNYFYELGKVLNEGCFL
ncbi:glycosyltransferase family 47 protein [Pleomorphovibrio marinus]|uniref:hypothetical protein n=1 Tax=Pleomorphovibrio marinus TaxID=2164132 RepID=UPI000E0A1282|nr:hypothetical protein [Pleomorphovibrio marinus]